MNDDPDAQELARARLARAFPPLGARWVAFGAGLAAMFGAERLGLPPVVALAVFLIVGVPVGLAVEPCGARAPYPVDGETYRCQRRGIFHRQHRSDTRDGSVVWRRGGLR